MDAREDDETVSTQPAALLMLSPSDLPTYSSISVAVTKGGEVLLLHSSRDTKGIFGQRHDAMHDEVDAFQDLVGMLPPSTLRKSGLCTPLQSG